MPCQHDLGGPLRPSAFTANANSKGSEFLKAVASISHSSFSRRKPTSSDSVPSNSIVGSSCTALFFPKEEECHFLLL